jgi:hypothetical protein
MRRNPLKLDEEELQILRDFERGEFESIQHFRVAARPTTASRNSSPVRPRPLMRVARGLSRRTLLAWSPSKPHTATGVRLYTR